MILPPSYFQYVSEQGARLAAIVLSRDNLHLAPETVSKAAIRRLKQGIRALEAYVRRMLILLALTFEPGLNPDQTERAVRYGPRSKSRASVFRIFTNDRDFPDLSHTLSANLSAPSKLISARPLLQRLSQLKALIEAPQARARRLAFSIARRRPGLLFAPGRAKAVCYRFGTELSTLYVGFAQAILNLSRARPPPIGAVPRPPPRIRSL